MSKRRTKARSGTNARSGDGGSLPSQVLVTLVRVGGSPFNHAHVCGLEAGSPPEYRELQSMGDFAYCRLFYNDPDWDLEIYDFEAGYLVLRQVTVPNDDPENPVGNCGTWYGSPPPDTSTDEADVTAYP